MWKLSRCFVLLQAGLEDLTVKEGILAFGHAAVVTFGALTDNVLEYMQDSTTPALNASAVQKVSSKSQTL